MSSQGFDNNLKSKQVTVSKNDLGRNLDRNYSKSFEQAINKGNRSNTND